MTKGELKELIEITIEELEVFAARLAAFPEGFIVVEQDETIVGYGTAEKWLTEREPALGEDARTIHWPDGRVFCITGMAVRQTYRGRGYGLAILDHLIGIPSAGLEHPAGG